MEGAIQRFPATGDPSKQREIKRASHCNASQTDSRVLDFKHRSTKECTEESRIVSWYNPCQVQEELQTKGTQLGVISKRRWRKVKEAHQEFEQVADAEEGQEVTDCNHQVAQHNTCNPVILVSILKDCAKKKDLQRGTKIHAVIVKRGLLKSSATFVGNSLVNFYAKCGALSKAREVFDQLVVRDVVSWNSLITGYAQHEHDKEALDCFELMQRQGLSPNAVTFTCILKACASLGAADKGQEIHAVIAREHSLKKNIFVGSTLVNMYAKFGVLEKAQEVFDELPTRNIVSWNALIAGYAQQGHNEEALNCFERMQQEGVSPDAVTFVCILKACGSIGAVEKGKVIHAHMVTEGFLENNILAGNSLVDLYVKCGLLGEAQHVFDELPVVDVVSWTSLIAGYAHYSHDEEAVKCFEQMRTEGFTPDDVTFVCTLKACGSIGDLCKGQEIHDEIVREGMLENNISLGNALVDLYVNCGMIAEAQEVFDQMPVRNIVSWNSLMGGYGRLGTDELVLNSFERLIGEGIEPDSVTFTVVFNMCSHKGLLDDGQMYFESMNTDYDIAPTLEHQTCMVDLFCRAGHLEKAVEIIKEMPFRANSTVWYTVLGACQSWGDMKIGQLVFEYVALLAENDAAAYICLGNIYAAAGREEDVENIDATKMENQQ